MMRKHLNDVSPTHSVATEFLHELIMLRDCFQVR